MVPCETTNGTPNLEIHRNSQILNHTLVKNDPGNMWKIARLFTKKIHDKRLFVMRTEKVRLFLYFGLTVIFIIWEIFFWYV